MTKENDHSKRDHALLSASSSARWLACPPSAAAAELYPKTGNAYTREGTLAHQVAEIYARGETVEPGDKYDREMIGHAEGYRDYINEQKTSPDAIVLLEQRVDFSPWVPHGFGTCDCIIIQDRTMVVIDYKYGTGVPVEAKDNPQMKLYALGALNDYGFAYDIETVEMHIYQPRIDNISPYTLSVDELMAWAEKTVKPTAEVAAKGKGDFKPGAHCKFCPHAGRCRALAKVCTEYVHAHGLKVKVPVMPPHELAEALKIEPLISLWIKRIKEQALTNLLNGEQVPGFKVVEGKLGNRKWTDELQVLAALEGAGYEKAEVTQTQLLSPAAMDKAIGKKKAAELLAGLTDRTPGAPTIVPETDKRPAYDRKAEIMKDFEEE